MFVVASHSPSSQEHKPFLCAVAVLQYHNIITLDVCLNSLREQRMQSTALLEMKGRITVHRSG
jgi:hypothetical protein